MMCHCFGALADEFDADWGNYEYLEQNKANVCSY